MIAKTPTEVLQDPTVMARMADTKALGEVKVLGAFFQVRKPRPMRLRGRALTVRCCGGVPTARR